MDHVTHLMVSHDFSWETFDWFKPILNATGIDTSPANAFFSTITDTNCSTLSYNSLSGWSRKGPMSSSHIITRLVESGLRGIQKVDKKIEYFLSNNELCKVQEGNLSSGHSSAEMYFTSCWFRYQLPLYTCSSCVFFICLLP